VIKSFFAVVLFYIAALASIAGHMFFYQNEKHAAEIEAASQLTTLPTLAFSTSYFSTDIHLYSLSANPAYPELLPINTLDFIYVK